MRTQAYPSYGKGIGDSYEETIIFRNYSEPPLFKDEIRMT